ncbi:MAG: hypothetical protein M3Y87_08955 [Myxococcota bacterium]|nr:hypothetical protein [Myxococcota bacterium]
MRSLGTTFFLVVGLLATACGEDAGPADDAGATTDGGGGGDDAGALGDDAGTGDSGPRPDDAGPGCADDGSDDTREGATDLGMINDRASFPAGTESGTISPITDLDWYTWHVEDVIAANVQPRAELRGLAGGRRMELCAYYACDSTSESVGCELGTAHELTAEIHGCCITGTDAVLAVKLSPSCSGTDDSGQVLVRVAQQGGEAMCLPAHSFVWGDE